MSDLGKCRTIGQPNILRLTMASIPLTGELSAPSPKWATVPAEVRIKSTTIYSLPRKLSASSPQRSTFHSFH
jgi:hypothetical protein